MRHTARRAALLGGRGPAGIRAVDDDVSLSGSGAQADSDDTSPAMTPDGRFVGFSSGADDLVAGDTGGYSDVFVRDRLLATVPARSVPAAEPCDAHCRAGAAGRSVAKVQQRSPGLATCRRR